MKEYYYNVFFQERYSKLRRFGEFMIARENSIYVEIQQYYSPGRLDLLCSISSPEGIIFVPLKSKYVRGYSPKYFKWKRKGETIDLLSRSRGDRYEMCSSKGDSYIGEFLVRDDNLFENGDIVEFGRSSDRSWSFVRVRKDKSHPNTHSAFEEVCSDVAVSLKMLYYVLRKYSYAIVGNSELSFYRMKDSIRVCGYSPTLDRTLFFYSRRRTKEKYDFIINKQKYFSIKKEDKKKI